jgi:hypothetical protein
MDSKMDRGGVAAGRDRQRFCRRENLILLVRGKNRVGTQRVRSREASHFPTCQPEFDSESALHTERQKPAKINYLETDFYVERVMGTTSAP